MIDKISILVMTYNRYSFLERLVRFYKASGCKITMHILDSSNETQGRDRLKALILEDHIKLHSFDSTVTPIGKIAEGLKFVTTPYVVLWADDDFLNPAAFEEGVQYLESHPDTSIVHGKSAVFSVGRNGIESVGPYVRNEIDEETGSQRLLRQLMDYTVTFYSIHRTELFRKNIECANINDFNYNWGEIVLGCLSAIQGKAHVISSLYLLKQGHVGVDSWKPATGISDLFDWVVDEKFSKKYRAFEGSLAQELMRVDGISQEEANEVVKKAFWGFIAQGLVHRWNHFYGSPLRLKSALKRTLYRLPFTKSLWQYIYSHLSWNEPGLSLKELTQEKSPHHRAFSLMQETTKQSVPVNICK